MLAVGSRFLSAVLGVLWSFDPELLVGYDSIFVNYNYKSMDASMKQIVSYIETHNTKQNEKIQKLHQANREQHEII